MTKPMKQNKMTQQTEAPQEWRAWTTRNIAGFATAHVRHSHSNDSGKSITST